VEKVNLKKGTFTTKGTDHAKDTTNIYERVQTGSGAAGENQQQTVGPDCPRSGIADSTLHHWRQLFAEQGEQAFPGSGHQTAQEEEIRRLKREVEILRQERDILKKALGIFSRSQL
jgi:transposase-like protein